MAAAEERGGTHIRRVALKWHRTAAAVLADDVDLVVDVFEATGGAVCTDTGCCSSDTVLVWTAGPVARSHIAPSFHTQVPLPTPMFIRLPCS